MKKFVPFLLALIMIFWSSTLAFATDKTDTQDNSTSDESDGGSMPTDFAIILLLIAGGTAVASFKRHRNDRDDYDEPRWNPRPSSIRCGCPSVRPPASTGCATEPPLRHPPRAPTLRDKTPAP